MGAVRPVYVELDIRSDMEKLWERTQSPDQHEQWDLRFTEIRYLPKRAEEPQRFRYTTRIGFGLRIEGTGETAGTIDTENGTRLSALRFGSDSRLSLIREGGGFWRYIPRDSEVTFMTQYNYKTRFGFIGRLVDRIAFRPLIGWATAWSFDRLRLWLEEGIPPAISLQRWLVHYGLAILLASLWLYQGIVPKLIAPWAGELDWLRATGLFNGSGRETLAVLGVLEAAFGILVLIRSRDRAIHALACVGLMALAVPALVANPQLWAAPLSPIVLNTAMIGLHGTAAALTSDLPSARNCRRKPQQTKRTGGEAHDVHL